MLLLALPAAKIFPVYHSNEKFIAAVEDVAGRASQMTEETLAALILEKARDLKIPEAQAPGAVSVVRIIRPDGPSRGGMCTVRVNYSRNVDIFGITSISMKTDREIAKPFLLLH